jgi:hypothetical protein
LNNVTAIGSGLQFFADAAKGDDTAAGTETAPFKTLLRAVQAVRAARNRTNSGSGDIGGRESDGHRTSVTPTATATATATATVTLRAGVFHLPDTLFLTSEDSNLVIQTHGSDAPNLAWLSGASPLTGVTWTAVNTTDGANIWVADLSATGGGGSNFDLAGLRLEGRRLWRARYPNGDPETTMPFKVGLKASMWLPSSTDGIPPFQQLSGPRRTDGSADATCMTISSTMMVLLGFLRSCALKFLPLRCRLLAVPVGGARWWFLLAVPVGGACCRAC